MLNIAHYDCLFRQTIWDNLSLYKIAKRTSGLRFEEFANYVTLTVLPMSPIDEDIAVPTKKLALEVATIVELLIRREAQKTTFSDPRNIVRSHIVVSDIFEPGNLAFNAVLSSGPSVSDPAGLIPGWISYRFKFGLVSI